MVRKNRSPGEQAGGSIAARMLLPENAPEFIYGVITIGILR
jgi:hypothetical protein